MRGVNALMYMRVPVREHVHGQGLWHAPGLHVGGHEQGRNEPKHSSPHVLTGGRVPAQIDEHLQKDKCARWVG